MYKITEHPILDPTPGEEIYFKYNGQKVQAEKGKTIAAALHQAGFPVHSHSLTNRNRSLECGIGKCGACEMLVDGVIRRICITKVDYVNEVCEIPKDYAPTKTKYPNPEPVEIHKTTVAIIGAGPAGLAARAVLNEHGIDNLVIDNNDSIGGQFNMQTHQFFFFENEKKYGGMRGFDIPTALIEGNQNGIFLNSTVWDILSGNRLAVKNIKTDTIYYVDAEHLIIATGAVPFMPSFENDDLPGVYTAAVVQKMMNTENTLLGKNILTIGAGNIGYLTSYQAMQAGANVKAILEVQPNEGGFPVQANRVRRLGIPIFLSHILVKAIPNKDHTGITGAVVAEAKNFKPIAGTERIISGIDTINICTGLVPDDSLLIKGKEVFGRNVHGCGDAIRIGEGTSAVLRGKQVAYEIIEDLGARYKYNDYLKISKEYIDSQQHPAKILQEARIPEQDRINKPFVIADCLYGFACNPCAFSCPHQAISKSSSSTVPVIDYDKCIGCMQCVTLCPGLAIFGYNLSKQWLFFPIEYQANEGESVFLVNNNGEKIGTGILEKIVKKPNKTNLARVKAIDVEGQALLNARGFIVQSQFPEEVEFSPSDTEIESKEFICHCDDVTMDEVMAVIGNRKFISIDEIKHTTRLGMGACRGKRCIKRLKTALIGSGIQVVGDATPRGPMSNQVSMGEIYPNKKHEIISPNLNGQKLETIETDVLIAGGGIGGSALFRYFAEAGRKPILINHDRGSSWRNIAGGRPVFSVPELADIAQNGHQIFKELQSISQINLTGINYVNLAHDEATYRALDASKAWSDSFMIEPKDFSKYIAPRFNTESKNYISALITKDCWQATPGLVIDLIRRIGMQHGGTIQEDTQLLDVEKTSKGYKALIKNHDGKFIKYTAKHFVNAMGSNAAEFASKLGIETGLYPVKHQAFITRRLPYLGVNNKPLDMIIDRKEHVGFNAVYGQQLAETGQIIGCASPSIEPLQTAQNLKINDKEFLEIISKVFVDWLPELSSVGFQAVWSGYYVEPRLIIDPSNGLFIGLRGHGFMMGMYLAKIYVDAMTGKKTPEYLSRLSLEGDGIQEKAFK